MRPFIHFGVTLPRYWEKPADPFGERVRTEGKDLRRPECPYCRHQLKKVPGAKTECRNCGQFMFVRTRPEDLARIVVTKAEAERIEADYQVLTGAREPDFRYIATKSEVRSVRTQLARSLLAGSDSALSDDDVKWELLRQKANEFADSGEAGSFRNNCYAMADFLARRWRLRASLELYLYVCIIDLNHKLPSLSPSPLDQIGRIARTLLLSEKEIRILVFELSKKFVVSGECAWVFLKSAIWAVPSSLTGNNQVIDLPGGRTAAIQRGFIPTPNDLFSLDSN